MKKITKERKSPHLSYVFVFPCSPEITKSRKKKKKKLILLMLHLVINKY